MTASELQRNLIFSGYSDVTDYLKNSPVNRFLYKRLLDILPKAEIDTSAITIFNEVYYQCARIQFDSNPGVDVQKRYLEECSAWIGSVSASELVFSLVWAFLKRKHKLSFHEECFMQSLCPLLDGCIFQGLAKDLVHFMELNQIFSPNEFETMPCPINEIPEKIGPDFLYEESTDIVVFIRKLISYIANPEKVKVNPWGEVTDNYTFSVMESYVKLYRLKEDQMGVLKRLINSCSGFERSSHQGDFNKLESRISSDEYLYHKNEYDPVCDSQEDFDARFGIGFNHALGMFAKEDEEQGKEELDALKDQLEQLRKNYEADLKKIEANYQDEIAALKKDLNKKTPSKTKEGTVRVEAPTELYMTINEIVSDAKEWFHESGASELTNMLYRYIKRHNYNLNTELWDEVESIIPAVEKRTAPQTLVEMPHVGQVNINPQKVENYIKEAE